MGLVGYLQPLFEDCRNLLGSGEISRLSGRLGKVVKWVGKYKALLVLLIHQGPKISFKRSMYQFSLFHLN